MGDLPPLIVVLGPTGSGKSDLALELAQRFNGEILNCDSVQLYRYLDIGAAKTPPNERRGIPHHLIDILNPDQHFTAGDYARLARPMLHDIASRGRVPVVTGGTGFYLRALLGGLFQGPARDQALRERLSRRGGERLHKLLARLDPPAAKRIHTNDVQKLVRALEVCLLTRRPLTELFKEAQSPRLEGFRVLKVGLDPPREQLAQRIDERCARMFRAGLIEEAKNIIAKEYSPNAKALLSIGYREAVLYLQGFLSYEGAVEETKTATRQYAKRQRTWFRREPDVFWIKDFGANPSTVLSAVEHVAAAMRFS